jgi:hypothetical protein
MEMKRLSLSARQRAANKAQDNPHGALVVFLLFLAVVLLSAKTVNAQWSVMNKYTEFGIGNFYMFVQRETDAKRIIQETLQDNNLPYQVAFRKGKNLLLSNSFADPLNNEYVYVVHIMKGRKKDVTGYHIFCYYLENRYRYFYDVEEIDGRVSVIHDPAVLDVSPNQSRSAKKEK